MVLNFHEFLYFVEHKRRYFEECWLTILVTFDLCPPNFLKIPYFMFYKRHTGLERHKGEK